MQPALWVSKTGLDAQQTNIATISNNLANASTVGYKKARAVFEDLFYQNINQPGGQSSQNTELPSGLMLGAGSKVVATQKVHTQGNVQTTNNSLDAMVEGHGFFQILMPDGNIGYTRNGQFTLNDEGTIVTSGSGYPLEPQIVVPDDAVKITIATDGQVSARIRGQQQDAILGQITLSDFINPGGLELSARTCSCQPVQVVIRRKVFRVLTAWGYPPVHVGDIECERDRRAGQHD